jgi:hypothetical protein
MTTPQKHLISQSNPWLTTLWVAAGVVGLAGLILTSTADPTAPDYDPVAAAFGPPLLTAAGALLAGLLAAGAICWQLRRR